MTTAMQKNNVQPGNGLTVINDIFNHTMRRFFDGNLWDSDTNPTTGNVPVNIRETENQYELDVIAPGCRKEDFKIHVQSNQLSISFQHDEQNKEANEKAGWVRNEYVQHSFTRSFTLDDTVSTDAITAAYENGILKVVLPKTEKAKPRLLSIEVK
jgi:HSP20 family protein